MQHDKYPLENVQLSISCPRVLSQEEETSQHSRDSCVIQNITDLRRKIGMVSWDASTSRFIETFSRPESNIFNGWNDPPNLYLYLHDSLINRSYANSKILVCSRSLEIFYSNLGSFPLCRRRYIFTGYWDENAGKIASVLLREVWSEQDLLRHKIVRLCRIIEWHLNFAWSKFINHLKIWSDTHEWAETRCIFVRKEYQKLCLPEIWLNFWIFENWV